MLVRSPILVVTDDDGCGGTARMAYRLAVGLRDTFEVTFACRISDGNSVLRDQLRGEGIRVVSLDVRESNVARSTFDYWAAVQLMSHVQPRLVLFCDAAEIGSCLAAKAVAAQSRIPYVSVIQGLLDGFPERFAWIADRCRQAIDQASAVVLVSEATRRRLEAAFPDIRTPLSVIHNTCSPVFFQPRDSATRQRVRREIGASDTDVVCLTAAYVNAWKGQRRTIAALERLVAEGRADGLRLVLAGSGDAAYLRDVHREIERKGLTDRVTLVGQREDIAALLDAADAFVLASAGEGLPVSIVEAMARGVPVIATAVGGIPEQLADGAGLLVAPPTSDGSECVRELAEALVLVTRERIRADLAASAQRRANAMFRPELAMARYRQLLEPIARSAPMAEPIALPTTVAISGVTRIDFRIPSQVWRYLGDGWWSVLEADGIWTIGPESFLTLPIAADWPGGELSLAFELTPLVTRTYRYQDTEVVVNGWPVARWRAKDARRQWLSAVTHVPASERVVDIRLVHHRAISPRRLGVSDDDRPLALRLHALTVSPVPGPDRGRRSGAGRPSWPETTSPRDPGARGAPSTAGRAGTPHHAAGTLILDVSSLAGWTGPPVGIARVEHALARYALARRPDVPLTVYDAASRSFRLLRREWAGILTGWSATLDGSGRDHRGRIHALPRLLSRLGLALERRRLMSAGGAATRWEQSLQALPAFRRYQYGVTAQNGHRHALVPVDVAAGRPITPGPDDTILSAGMDWFHKSIRVVGELKRRTGCRYVVLCYDILPLTHDEFFKPQDIELFRRYWHAMFPLADRVLFTSRRVEADVRAYCERERLPLQETGLVTLGYDLEAQDGDRPLPPGLESGRFALFVSTIEPRKGHDMLLSVWRRLLVEGIPQRHRFKLVLVGRGGWMVDGVLRQLADPASFDGTVVHLGGASDSELATLYHHAAFCLYPSVYEGFGLPIVESFARGKAVIASTGGAVPEIVGDLSPCLDARDAGAWHALLGRWIEDDAARRPYETRIGRSFWHPTWEQAAARVFELSARGAGVGEPTAGS